MQLNASRIVSPTLEDAIDRHLLTVAPDTPLEEVIAQMSCARGSGCSLVDIDSPSPFLIQPEPRSSCSLVMRGNELAGIFTERDIVRLTAMGADFTSLTIGEVMTHPVKTLTQSTFQDIFAALFLFRRYRVRHLPIVDDQDQLVGIVSPESIRRVLRPANLLKLRRVSDVMTSQVICAPLTASIMSLAQQMAEHWVSCVVIVETDWLDTAYRQLNAVMPVGIVTERDLVQFQSLQLNLNKLQAQDVMSTPLFLLSPEDSLWTAHQEMQQRHVRRLVVSWNWGSRLGIVTQTSLLRVFDPIEMYGVIETLQRTVHQLEGNSAALSAAEPLEQFLESQVERSVPLGGSDRLSALTQSFASEETIAVEELQTLLASTQDCLEFLVREPGMPLEQRQTQISLALAKLAQMQTALGTSRASKAS